MHGLKEWSLVCDALAEGRQLMLLRKGGIYESAGEFEIEHRRFVLFPTFLHQSLAQLKPDRHSAFRSVSAEPDHVMLRVTGEVTDIVRVSSRAQIDRVDAEHIWAPPLIDMRFNYRPENPLYVLVVRAGVLDRPLTVANSPAYAGCKSWVPLEEPIEIAAARPVLDETTFQLRRERLLASLSA